MNLGLNIRLNRNLNRIRTAGTMSMRKTIMCIVSLGLLLLTALVSFLYAKGALRVIYQDEVVQMEQVCQVATDVLGAYGQLKIGEEWDMHGVKVSVLDPKAHTIPEQGEVVRDMHTVALYKPVGIGSQRVILSVVKNDEDYMRRIMAVCLMPTLLMIAVGFGIMLLLNNLVFRPLCSLNGAIQNVCREQNEIDTNQYAGFPELMPLVEKVNEMRRDLLISNISLESFNSALFTFREAIKVASDDIMILDQAAEISYVNTSTLKNMGFSEEDMLGRSIWSFVVRKDSQKHEVIELIMDKIINIQPWNGELYFRNADGTSTINEISINPVPDEKDCLQHVLVIKHSIEEKKNYENMLVDIAHTDTLTNLPNRLSFNETLAKALSENTSVTVMFFDLDNFKYINDTMGHRVGDILIKQTADRLMTCLEDVYVSRMGDDEFIAIMTEQSEKHIKKIMGLFEEPFKYDGRTFKLSISAGSSSYPTDAASADALLKNADAAMHKAKTTGRGRYLAFDQTMNDGLLKRARLSERMDYALENGEFVPYFQPKVLAADGSMYGSEALLRWETEEGIVSPSEFLPIAEETGHIVPISWRMLQQACKCNAELSKNGFDVNVAVNMPPQVLLHEDLFRIIDNIVEETDMDLHRLDIEITENALVGDVGMTNEVLDKLHERGISISVDDFGTGYSSLGYLQKLRIDRIKIDTSFVRGIPYETDSTAIIDAIIAMGKSLGLSVTAEGVEYLEQLGYLRSRGCDEIQGFYVSRPICFKDYGQWIDDNYRKMNLSLKQESQFYKYWMSMDSS